MRRARPAPCVRRQLDGRRRSPASRGTASAPAPPDVGAAPAGRAATVRRTSRRGPASRSRPTLDLVDDRADEQRDVGERLGVGLRRRGRRASRYARIDVQRRHRAERAVRRRLRVCRRGRRARRRGARLPEAGRRRTRRSRRPRPARRWRIDRSATAVPPGSGAARWPARSRAGGGPRAPGPSGARAPCTRLEHRGQAARGRSAAVYISCTAVLEARRVLVRLMNRQTPKLERNMIWRALRMRPRADWWRAAIACSASKTCAGSASWASTVASSIAVTRIGVGRSMSGRPSSSGVDPPAPVRGIGRVEPSGQLGPGLRRRARCRRASRGWAAVQGCATAWLVSRRRGRPRCVPPAAAPCRRAGWSQPKRSMPRPTRNSSCRSIALRSTPAGTPASRS